MTPHPSESLPQIGSPVYVISLQTLIRKRGTHHWPEQDHWESWLADTDTLIHPAASRRSYMHSCSISQRWTTVSQSRSHAWLHTMLYWLHLRLRKKARAMTVPQMADCWDWPWPFSLMSQPQKPLNMYLLLSDSEKGKTEQCAMFVTAPYAPGCCISVKLFMSCCQTDDLFDYLIVLLTFRTAEICGACDENTHTDEKKQNKTMPSKF